MSMVKIDMHQWLPGWGENKVVTRSENGDLVVEVTCDGSNGDEEMRSLIFKSTCFFSVGSFPGINSLSHKYDYDFETGSVIETSNSELAEEWNNYWSKALPQSKNSSHHYIIFFGSENKVIHVVAVDVIVR